MAPRTVQTSQKGWQSRIVGHGTLSPEDLLANPRNWRQHPAEQQAALASVLDRVGWVQDVVINRTTGHLIDGHLRAELAQSRGEAEVPVVYVELDEAEELLILATLDPLSAMATTDQGALEALLAEVSADGALGDMLAELVGEPKVKPGLTDPDDVPDEPEEPYVQRSEVYRLGDHRLMCGDCTDAGDVARLLDGAKPALMVTDPPYGVEYDPNWRNEAADKGNLSYAAVRVGEVANDDRADWTEAWILAPAAVAYCWHASHHGGVVQSSLERVGFEIRNQVIWAKPGFAISRGHYNWQHEPCWYAVRKGATASWIGDHSQTTLWELNLDKNVEGGHSTQKPVECMERPLRNHAGDVYDPFLGSGTTIIAAERQSRRCYAMEIEPKYVQVAIERWENYTGQKAERIT